MAKVDRSHFGSSCSFAPPTHTYTGISGGGLEGTPSFSLYSRSVRGKGSRSRGSSVPKEHVPPPQKFSWTVPGFSPLVFVTRGFFLPLGLLPPTGRVSFSDKGGKGDSPLEAPLYVPGTHPTPFERLGMRDLRPPLGSTCTKVGLLLQGCTIVVAATHGGGAAAP